MKPGAPADPVELLTRLPLASEAGSVGMYLLDPSGEILSRRGHDDGLPARCDDPSLRAALAPGRRFAIRPFGIGDLRLLTTYVESNAAGEALLDAITALTAEWLRLETDLENISPSSLALMEEVAMVHELTSKLPTCADGAEVARLALEELMIAADVERGFYVVFDRASEHGRIAVALRSEGRRPEVLEGVTDRLVMLHDGVLERVLRARSGPVIEVVGESPLGRPGSPESFAKREVLAVPVAYGDGDEARNVGALVLCDKRGAHRAFGSQESKMANNVAAMVGGAIGHRVVASLGKELELAREIQQQILPRRPARVAGFDIAASCDTSGSVGGDYFDFVTMADGRTLALVADVSGHNLPSGMVMVGTRASLRIIASRAASPTAVFEELLEATFEDLRRTELFVTAAAVALTAESGDVELVNAGHNEAILCRARSGRIETFSTGGAVFGFRRGESYAAASATMRRGDVLLLYTDGLVEARDGAGRMFGEERLTATLQAARRGSAEEIVTALSDAIRSFTGRTDHDDDVTAVVIKSTRTTSRKRRGG